MSDPPARLAGIESLLKGELQMINNNPMNTIIEDIRKAQQARYDKEDKAILEAIEGLSLANEYMQVMFNLDEEVK